VVLALESAWAEGRPEDVAPFVDADAVTWGPDLQQAAVGPRAWVHGYRSFLDAAEVQLFSIEEVRTHEAESTATVVVRYRLVYVMGDDRRDDRGLDVFTLRDDGSRWLVTSRLLVPGSGE
jgi:hypothetical protein